MKNTRLLDILKEAELISSISEGRRLILQGGVSINSEKVDNPDIVVNLSKDPIVVKVGKRRYLRITE